VNEKGLKKILQASQLRVTKIRLDILYLFMTNNYALTHTDINVKLNNRYDDVTIYRTIHSFEENGIIHKIPDNSKKACFAINKEWKSGEGTGNTHVHFHCIQCGHNFCMSMDNNFKIKFPDNLSVSFVNILADGLCDKCNPN
jgi:Fur family ferric uptake transcriptional regulator